MATQAIIKHRRKRKFLVGELFNADDEQFTWPSWYSESDVEDSFKLEGENTETIEKTIQRVTRMQAIVRGKLARNFGAKVFFSKSLVRKQAIQEVQLETRNYYLGWNRYCLHILNIILIITVAWSQLFSSSPSSNKMDKALQKAVNSVQYDGGSKSLTDVRNVAEFHQFLRGMVLTLYRSDPYHPPACEPGSCFDVNFNKTWEGECLRLFHEFSGFLDPFNRQQLGLLVYQRRIRMQPCDVNVKSLYEESGIFHDPYANRSCASDDLMTEYDSIKMKDPSTLQQIKNASEEDILDYNPDFKAFVGMLDLGFGNLHPEDAACKVSFYEEIEWIDRETREACIALLVHNENGIGKYGMFRICFFFENGGSTDIKLEIGSASAYQSSESVGTIVLTVLYAVFVLLAFGGYLISLRSLVSKRGWRQFFRASNAAESMFWIFEGTQYALQIWVIILYFTVLLHYDGVFQPYNGEGAEALMNSLAIVVDLLDAEKFVRVVYSVILFAMVVRSVYLMEFHSDIAIVGRILRNAVYPLLSFGLVFFIILVLYAYAGVLLCSTRGGPFSTFARSFQTMLFVSLGEFGSTIDAIYAENFVSQGILPSIFLWSFIFLTSLLLFNVLLSIVVNTYMDFQEEKNNVMRVKFMQSLGMYFSILSYDIRTYYVPTFCPCCKRRRARRKDQSQSVMEGQAQAMSMIELCQIQRNRGIPRRESTKLFQGSCFSQDTPVEKLLELKVPHTFLTWNSLLTGFAQTEVPTFVLRKELSKCFTSNQVETLLAVMRDRSSTTKSNLLKEEMDMFFGGKKDSDLFAISVIQKILRILERKDIILPDQILSTT